MDTMYDSSVEGLCGNDDAGQMSAWYVFSSLGFYPVTPGSEDYAIGSPLITEATIHLNNGKILHIKATNKSEKNIYVKRVTFNGKLIENNTLQHNTLVNGGELIYEMSAVSLNSSD